MSEIIPEAYQKLLENVRTECRKAELDRLSRYYKVGQYFVEFLDGHTRGIYGAATVEKLADDISPMLPDIADVSRFLYWSKQLVETFPDTSKLEALIAKGFTATHAKILCSVEPELRAEMEQKLLESDKVCSTRELEAMIREPAETIPRREPKDTPEEKVKKDPVDKDEAKVRAKILTKFTRRLQQDSETLADVFIFIKETLTAGVDASMQNNFNCQMADLKEAAETLIQPLEALIKTVEKELQ